MALDLSVEISLPVWDKTLSEISSPGVLQLYQTNSFYREIVLDLLKRGFLEEQFYLSEFGRIYKEEGLDIDYRSENTWETGYIHGYLLGASSDKPNSLYIGEYESTLLADELFDGGGYNYTQDQFNEQIERNIQILRDFQKSGNNNYYFKEILLKILELNQIPLELLRIGFGLLEIRFLFELSVKANLDPEIRNEIRAIEYVRRDASFNRIWKDRDDHDFVVMLNKDKSNQESRKDLWKSLGWTE